MCHKCLICRRSDENSWTLLQTVWKKGWAPSCHAMDCRPTDDPNEIEEFLDKTLQTPERSVTVAEGMISMISSCKQVEQLLAYCRLRLHSIGILHWNMDSVIASKLVPQFDQAHPGTKVFDGFCMFLYVPTGCFDCLRPRPLCWHWVLDFCSSSSNSWRPWGAVT